MWIGAQIKQLLFPSLFSFFTTMHTELVLWQFRNWSAVCILKYIQSGSPPVLTILFYYNENTNPIDQTDPASVTQKLSEINKITWSHGACIHRKLLNREENQNKLFPRQSCNNLKGNNVSAYKIKLNNKVFWKSTRTKSQHFWSLKTKWCVLDFQLKKILLIIEG